MNEPAYRYQRIELCQLAERLVEVRICGMELLKTTGIYTAGCQSIHPLGMALIEATDLFSLLDERVDMRSVRSLFDGGESEGPNIETRLRCIRDYCNAAQYAARIRAEDAYDSERCPFDVEEYEGVGEEEWLKRISPHANSTGHELVEVARLLDDTLESILNISRHISRLINGDVEKPHEACYWNEIYRHTWHIGFHFDYAEDALISCLRVASE